MKYGVKFLWSDNWWVEDGRAWFVAGRFNALFQLDMNTDQCKLLAQLPDCEIDRLRLNSMCIKCGNEIFCMPHMGECIWVYQLEPGQFYKISIEHEGGVCLSITYFEKYGDRVYVLSCGLKQIIEINIQKRAVEHYYCLTDSSDTIGRSVTVGDSIYIVLQETNRVCQFNMVTKNITTYTIPNVKGKLYTICHDGENFWLSGHRREIYIWNKENDTVTTIDDLPPQFGIYLLEKDKSFQLDCSAMEYNVPAFYDSVYVGHYIWFIPFQTNKLLRLNKDTYEIETFEIEDEEETESSFNVYHRLKDKYILECVIENRYIILFSLKNNYIVKIDVVDNKVEIKSYIIDFSNMDNCILHERTIDRKIIFEQMLYHSVEKKSFGNIGLNIKNKLWDSIEN